MQRHLTWRGIRRTASAGSLYRRGGQRMSTPTSDAAATLCCQVCCGSPSGIRCSPWRDGCKGVRCSLPGRHDVHAARLPGPPPAAGSDCTPQHLFCSRPLHTQVCGRPTVQPLACPGCGVFAYCSAKHLRLHREQLGHGEECGRMAAQAARRQVTGAAASGPLAGRFLVWSSGLCACPLTCWRSARCVCHACPRVAAGAGESPVPLGPRHPPPAALRLAAAPGPARRGALAARVPMRWWRRPRGGAVGRARPAAAPAAAAGRPATDAHQPGRAQAAAGRLAGPACRPGTLPNIPGEAPPLLLPLPWPDPTVASSAAWLACS